MELLHRDLERALAAERVPTPARVPQDIPQTEAQAESSASLTSLSASSLSSRRTARYETESRRRPRAAA